MQSASPGAAPALHLLTSYFIDSILGSRSAAAGHHGELQREGTWRDGSGDRFLENAPSNLNSPGTLGGSFRVRAVAH